MPDDISPEDLRMEKLSEKHKDLLGTFESDETDFKDFLVEDALKHQDAAVSTTYLFFYNPENKFVGYVTLLGDRVNINGTELESLFEEKNLPSRAIPALKIGKICVRKGYEGRNIGSEMIFFAMRQAVDFSKKAGFRFLIVNAKHKAMGYFDMIRTIRYKRDIEKQSEAIVN